MAVKKAAGGTKKKDASSAKKAASTKKGAGAVKKAAAPKKVAATKKAAPRTGVKKAGAAPAKLSTSQADLLKKIGSAGEGGYKSEKKAEQRSIDSLQEKKLIKRGAKDKASGTYPYMISNAGKKHLDSQAPAAGGGSGGGGAASTGGGNTVGNG